MVRVVVVVASRFGHLGMALVEGIVGVGGGRGRGHVHAVGTWTGSHGGDVSSLAAESDDEDWKRTGRDGGGEGSRQAPIFACPPRAWRVPRVRHCPGSAPTSLGAGTMPVWAASGVRRPQLVIMPKKGRSLSLRTSGDVTIGHGGSARALRSVTQNYSGPPEGLFLKLARR